MTLAWSGGDRYDPHWPSGAAVTRAAASTRVLQYYSSKFLLLEYSLISISGSKFPFQLQFSAVIWQFHPHRCNMLPFRGEKLQNRSLSYLNTGALHFALRAMLPVTILTLTHQFTTPSSSLAACIKVLPVLTSTRVLVKVLGRVVE